MKQITLIGLIGLILYSCNSEPKPIHYNLDVCEFCHMVITDQRYGTEILTPKGKAYKFDSFECLIDYQKESPVEVGQYLITSFDKPGILQNADESWVIKCKEMPSPMGRYLTVFKEKEKALEIIQKTEGEILPFNEALQKF